MKLTRRQLRQLIEMAYKGHLGVIPSTTEPNVNNLSGGLESTLEDIDIPDDILDGPEEDYDNFIKKYAEKQRKNAEVYARSPHFNKQAERLYGRLEANIWVLTKIGEFTELETLDQQIIDATSDYGEYNPLGGRANFYDLDERAMSFLREVSDEDTHKKLDKVQPSDTVIFNSNDGVGVKSNMIKNSPWMIFHAMIHNDEMIAHFQDYYIGLDRHKFDLPVHNFLTMKAAGGKPSQSKAKPSKPYPPFLRDEMFGDVYSEMIVQELLGKRGLVIRRDLLSPKDLKYVDERLIPAVKGFAKMMREEIKGKLIVIRGT